MREMKDSGIEWIGEIPKHWSFYKIKHFFDFEKGKNAALYTQEYIGEHIGEYPLYSGQTENNGVMGRIDTFDYDLGKCLFTTTVGAKVMTPRILQGKFSLSQNCLIMKQIKDCSIEFFYYALLPLFAYEKSMIPSYMQPSLRMEDLRKYGFFIPSISEQKAIADFLDRRCAEIDAVIAKTKETIEEYKKLKQQIIIEAITKGIRENRTFKDSGIDWIGQVPIETEIIKIKYITNVSRGLFNHRPRNDERYYGGDYPFIQTGDVARAGKYITTYSQTLNELGISVSKRFPKGTMTMTIAANIGDVAILGFDAYFPDSVVGFTPKEGFLENYVYYLFCSMKEMFIRTAVVSTQLNLNLDRIKELFVPITRDLDEQKEIAYYLDKKCVEVDTLIAKKTALLEEMETYKKSVIYEYVTGKKEIV